jgi:SagB-type dehydrogenase family enzyme
MRFDYMNAKFSVMAILCVAFLAAAGSATPAQDVSISVSQPGTAEMKLSLPAPSGGMALNEVLQDRRSIRTLKGDSLSEAEVSQLLWACQGITDDKGHRTAGSSWESYPLEVYLIAGNVTDISPGVYHYIPKNSSIEKISDGDVRQEFVNSSVISANAWIGRAPVIFVMTAVFERGKDRSMNDSATITELGMASQNLLLEVTSLGLGSTYVAGFNSTAAGEFLGLPEGTVPLGLMPAGHAA